VSVKAFLCVIAEEEIDGDAYLGLTETIMLDRLHMKAGQVIKVLRHQKSLFTKVSIILVFISNC
jgi:hypothetical protein